MSSLKLFLLTFTFCAGVFLAVQHHSAVLNYSKDIWRKEQGQPPARAEEAQLPQTQPIQQLGTLPALVVKLTKQNELIITVASDNPHHIVFNGTVVSSISTKEASEVMVVQVMLDGQPAWMVVPQ